jgi:mono/diheme cytochrome c family protein
MRHITLIAMALLMGVAMLLSGAGRAGAEVAAGQRLYLQYCSACHGPAGKGDGVVSGFMRPKPPDLTVLAQHNRGVFPTALVVNVIDGRATSRAHGDPDMPVWGRILQSDAAEGSDPELAVHSIVTQITDYLRSIQAK